MNPVPARPALPTLEQGTMVDVSPDETMGITHFGIVCNVNNGQPDIIAFPITNDALELRPFRYCLHVDDPTIEARKADIRQDEFRGVYRLSQGEIRNRRLAEAHSALEQSQLDMGKKLHDTLVANAALSDRVEALEDIARRTGSLASPQPAKRGPGRPPKQRT